MTGHRWIPMALLAASAALGAGGAHAALYTSAQTVGAGNADIKEARFGELHSQSSFDQDGSRSTQWVTASHGVIKAYATAQATGGSPISGTSVGRWSDEITLHNPLLTGKYGTLRLNFNYDHQFETVTQRHGGTVQAYYVNEIDVGRGEYTALAHRQVDNSYHVFDYHHYGVIKDREGVRTTTDDEISLLIGFAWGVPFSVSQSVTVQCGAGFNAAAAPNARCITESAHFSYWDGISDVLTGGVGITDFQVTSASGTDYSYSFVPAPVPEPEQIWMLAVGAGVGLLAARRRTRTVR